MIVGHEPVGVIEELGEGVTGYDVGQRVIVGAITPCGQCYHCLDGHQAQCGGKPIGGWRFGNSIDGCQAEYLLVPNAQANLSLIPDGLTDEQVLMCPDIMSTGFGGAEFGQIKIGDTVAVFAQGPIGLCVTAGAKLKGATRIIVVDLIVRAGSCDLGELAPIAPRPTDCRRTGSRCTGGCALDQRSVATGRDSVADSNGFVRGRCL